MTAASLLGGVSVGPGTGTVRSCCTKYYVPSSAVSTPPSACTSAALKVARATPGNGDDKINMFGIEAGEEGGSYLLVLVTVTPR